MSPNPPGIRREVLGPRVRRLAVVKPGVCAVLVSVALLSAGHQWALLVSETRTLAMTRRIERSVDQKMQALCEVPTLCVNAAGNWQRCPWVKEPRAATTWPDPP